MDGPGDMDGAHDTLALLRAQIARIERRAGHLEAAGMLSTGIEPIDLALGGGLLRGAVHDLHGGGIGQTVSGVPTRFATALLARHPGPVVWLSARRIDLHVAAMRAAGLNPGRVICVECDTADLFGLCEDILRESGLLALVADLATAPDLTGSRRLQLAARRGGVTGLMLHAPSDARARPAPGAGQTRWRLYPLPSRRGRAARWQVDLLGQRGGPSNSWQIEFADADPSYSLDLAAVVCDGMLETAPSGRGGGSRAGAVCA